MKIIPALLIYLLCSLPISCAGMTVGFLVGSGGLGDESFNDMTYTGLGKALEIHKFTLIYREWEQHLSMDVLLEEMINEGAELLVLNGDQFLPLIKKYSPLHPNLYFIANDFDGGSFPNVKSILYKQHEGAFLAGVLTAMFTRTGQVGFIGAINIPVVKAFEVGFEEGVEYVSPETIITTSYISSLPDYSGFNNPRHAFGIANSLYNQGVDIIFAVAGLSGNGVIRAANTTGNFVIGVDSDQDHMAKGYVLTSVMKRLDIAVYTEVTNILSNTFKPGTTWYGLENNGISLTPMKYTRDIIPVKTRNTLKNIADKIISGEIHVSNILAPKN